MKRRSGYRRPMRGWWLRNPYYIRYMAREATAVFVAAYAIVLLTGLLRLSQGQPAWEGWLRALQSPWALLFHALVLATFLYHTWSWFRIMPKTLPIIIIGGERLRPAAITALGIAAAAVASAGLIFAVAAFT